MNETMSKNRKAKALARALEISKEAARGGHENPAEVLKEIYKAYLEIAEDVFSTPE